MNIHYWWVHCDSLRLKIDQVELLTQANMWVCSQGYIIPAISHLQRSSPSFPECMCVLSLLTGRTYITLPSDLVWPYDMTKKKGEKMTFYDFWAQVLGDLIVCFLLGSQMPRKKSHYPGSPTLWGSPRQLLEGVMQRKTACWSARYTFKPLNFEWLITHQQQMETISSLSSYYRDQQ